MKGTMTLYAMTSSRLGEALSPIEQYPSTIKVPYK